MLAEVIVAVSIDGRAIASSIPATIRRGVVCVPLQPFGLDIARTVDVDAPGRRFVLARDGKRIAIVLGSPLARSGEDAQALPIAPFLRGEEPIIPLAAIARALGASVTYDAGARSLAIVLPPAGSLATLGPFVPTPEPSEPLPTFAPHVAATPQPEISGVPKPRRTPILVDNRL